MKQSHIDNMHLVGLDFVFLAVNKLITVKMQNIFLLLLNFLVS